jgi:hypothetical protein
MKRRETKKGIQQTEKQLAGYVRDFLNANKQGDEELTYKTGMASCIMLASLLAWYLRLNPSWNDKERWIDGLINGHIHLRHPNEICVHGEMVWGLLRDVGGPQWKEPFSAIACLGRRWDKLISYTLRFGKDVALSEKLVESGSYYVLLPKEEVEVSDSGEVLCGYPADNADYCFCFSKPVRPVRTCPPTSKSQSSSEI